MVIQQHQVVVQMLLKITQVTGTFMQGEQIIFNEDPEISRSIKTVELLEYKI